MFDSKAQKAEKDYRYLTDILRSSNITTEEAVEQHLQKVTSKALYASVILIAIIAILCLLFSKYYPIWAITGMMCFAWIWRSAIVARNIMRRYIKEEINAGNHNEPK